MTRCNAVFLRLLLLFSLLLCATMAQAGRITIAWDASTSPNIAGYKVYFGKAAGVYGTPITIGNVLTYTLDNLEAGVTWYITVTAFDTSGMESDFATSAEDPTKQYVSATIPALQGDLNNDGQINVVDLQLMINAILGVAPAVGADINNDGQVNVVDLQILVNTILGK